MLEIWEAKVKKENTNELPIIIPLVIYHGKDDRNIKGTLGEMIKGYEDLPEDVKKYVPDYEYLLYDISRYTDEQIKGEVQLRIILTIFRDIFTKDNKGLRASILRATEYLRDPDNKQTGIEYFETFMRYILNAGQKLTKEDILEKIEKNYPEGSEVVMTLTEQLKREGREEGIIKGMEVGMEKGAKQRAIIVAPKLLKMNMPID